ncbi:MAG: hypothetical protein J6Y47_05850 [Bacteroidales bacterium]|nr:hypothetical protein [Bacteroidales bacterium]
MKYGKTILGTLLTIGALMVPVSTKAQMPLGMKIQTVNSLLFEDEKTHKIEEVKLPPMRQLTKKEKKEIQENFSYSMKMLGLLILIMIVAKLDDHYKEKCKKSYQGNCYTADCGR